jgi:hypothetical protein
MGHRILNATSVASAPDTSQPLTVQAGRLELVSTNELTGLGARKG